MKRTGSPDFVRPELFKRPRHVEPASEPVGMSQPRAQPRTQPRPQPRTQPRTQPKPQPKPQPRTQPKTQPRTQVPENQRKTDKVYKVSGVSRDWIWYLDEAGKACQASYPLICGGTLTGAVELEGVKRRTAMLNLHQQDEATLKKYEIRKIGNSYFWGA